MQYRGWLLSVERCAVDAAGDLEAVMSCFKDFKQAWRQRVGLTNMHNKLWLPEGYLENFTFI